MERFYYGQRIVDHRNRWFTLTELYWAVEQFNEQEPSHCIEFDNGYRTYIQGVFDQCRLAKIGFIDAEQKVNVLTVEEARQYIAKRFLNFE